jgi:hypothetical protein
MHIMRLKMDPRRVCRPVVEGSHHFDEEKNPGPLLSEKRDADTD